MIFSILAKNIVEYIFDNFRLMRSPDLRKKRSPILPLTKSNHMGIIENFTISSQ